MMGILKTVVNIFISLLVGCCLLRGESIVYANHPFGEPKECGIQGISAIYVVNLERRPDRWIKIAKELKNFGLNVTRIEAVDGLSLSQKTKKILVEDPTEEGVFDLTPGQIGCALSHISVWKKALQTNMNVIWVLEDDATFKKNPTVISKLLTEIELIDPDWDILYTDLNIRYKLGSLFADGCPYRKVLIKDESYYQRKNRISDSFTRIYARFGMYSMIISKRGLKKLWDSMAQQKLFAPIDHQIHMIHSLRQYSTNQEIVSHRPDLSDSDTARRS